MKPLRWLFSALLCGSSLALAAVPQRTLTFTLPDKPLPALEWEKPLETTALRGYYGWGETPDAVAVKAQSPDGQCKAATQNGGSVRLECAGASPRILAVHKNLITRLAFSPDSRFLVTGTYGGSLKWIDLRSGAILHDFYDPTLKSRYRLGHAGQLQALFFAPGDSTTLFTFAHDGSLKRWNTETGQLEGALYGVSDFQPAQDGQNLWLARPTALQQVRSSDFSTLKRLEGMSGPFKLSKDEKYAQIQNKFVLNLETGKLLNDGPALAWAVSPDGKTVAAHRGHKVNLYALEGQKPLNTLEGFYPERYSSNDSCNGPIQASVRFSSNGHFIYSDSFVMLECTMNAGYSRFPINYEARLYNLETKRLFSFGSKDWRPRIGTGPELVSFDGPPFEFIDRDTPRLFTVNEQAQLKRVQKVSSLNTYLELWRGRLVRVYGSITANPSTNIESYSLRLEGGKAQKLFDVLSSTSDDGTVSTDIIFSRSRDYFVVALKDENPNVKTQSFYPHWPVHMFKTGTGKPLSGFPRYLLPNDTQSNVTAVSDDGHWILHSGGLFDTRKLKNYPLEPQNLKFVQFGGDGKSVWWGNGERLERWSLPD